MKKPSLLSSLILSTSLFFAGSQVLAATAPPPPPGKAAKAKKSSNKSKKRKAGGKKRKGKKGKAEAAAEVPAPPAAAVPSSGPPSAQQKGAEAAYGEGKYEESAVAFAAIAVGGAPGDVARAQFWLGKALTKLDFHAAALAVFDDIVKAGTAHPYHRVTLPWLAALSRHLPEGAGVLERVGTYQPSELENDEFDTVRDELYYLLGRYYYRKGDLGQSTALLAQVPWDSDYYIPAQFFVGVAETREFHAEPSVKAFKEVLRKNIMLRETEDKRRARKMEKKKKKLMRMSKKRREKLGLSDEELAFDEQNQRFYELATLSLGYIFYQVGKFPTALKYFGNVPMTSPYYLDATFASAWSEFRMVEVEPENSNVHYQRSLGYIHTLNAPFFYDYLYPEAMILKAVTYYFNCQYPPAKFAINDFNERYLSVRDQLQGILDSAPGDQALYDLATKIRSSKSDLDPFVERVAAKSLSDRTLSKHFEYVARLILETERLEGMSDAFRNGSAGELISENIDLNVSVAQEATGALARKRIVGQISEIKKLERQSIKVEYEILEMLKKLGPEIPSVLQKPKVDREHEIYNYNGEYWQDELGFYYYKVTSRCQE